MDFRQLASEITVFLTPFFPYLILGAEEAIKGVGKKFGEATWEKAKSLWAKIQVISQSDPKLNSATVGLAEDPTDEDYQLILAKALAEQLRASPELASDLMKLIKSDAAIQSILIEKGSKVKDIRQHLSKTGKQETIVRESEAGNITQEQ